MAVWQQREIEMVKIYYEYLSKQLQVAAVSPVFPTSPGYEWEPALHCSHENI